MSEHDAMARFVTVTRKSLRQKEITVSMTDGRYAKNEIIVHLTGLDPDFSIEQAVTEAATAMDKLQERNPIMLTATKGKLPDKSEE